MSERKRKCPVCDDGWDVEWNYPHNLSKCNLCKGTGKISMKLYMEYVRAHRRVENE